MLEDNFNHSTQETEVDGYREVPGQQSGPLVRPHLQIIIVKE